ncbi:MAG: TetR/AcrR family transcriptional regulator C-terminal domain-containing protein [Oscillospiraceae bacterium]|nr:TetR/AcrR family transcriptional regulator C-terminal domain-containing protein [Oscillospiraceae bacterium]
MSQRTEKAIAASFKHLLQKKSLNKITISDITNDCGINRMTFYYHFRDIYDLIEWICNEDYKAAVEGNKNFENWEEDLEQFIDVLYGDRDFIQNAFHSIQRGQIDEYLHKVLSDILSRAVNSFASSQLVSEEDRKFIIDFYTFAFSGLLVQWIEDGMPDERERLVSQIMTMTRGTIQDSLERFEKHRDEKHDSVSFS